MGRGVRREEVRDRVRRPSRTAEELDRPFGDPLRRHVVVAGVRLVDVLALEDQGARLFGTGRALRERASVGDGCEREALHWMKR